MNLAQALTTFVTLNILVLVGFACLMLFSILIKKNHVKLDALSELRLHYAVISTIICFAAVHPLLPKNDFFKPAGKVWSAQSIKSFGSEYSKSESGGYLSVPTLMGATTVQADRLAVVWSVLFFLMTSLGVLYIARDFKKLMRIKQNSFLVRRIGKVRIFINDKIQIPFTFWLPGQANIFMPASLIGKSEDYRMAMAHEFQHHRHGDTLWVYIIWGFRLVCVINPIIHIWNRWISEIQEFACDETLVDQNKVESQAYARCLVEVAKTAINQKYDPVSATGLTFLSESYLLKRRIENMLSNKQNRIGRSISVSVGILIASLMGLTAYAAQGLVQDRRVNLSQANAMAIKAQSKTGFPIIVNELVLKQLNKYIGTPEGRDFMRNSLARMKNYEATVGEYLQKYNVPAEILAVPIIESDYQNLTEGQGGSALRAAGLWQFIPSTARNYGLIVDSHKDERLDVELNTDAAMRYLLSNALRFKDWHLAVLSYNMGESAVQKGMNVLKSKDAWTLIRNGYEGDKDYLPKLIAAILIMKNPEALD